mmetsp:Transcript_4315/g.9565  ORF Transcript_4315/g.9565 Transcript_4315/m.9565 type:complete len:86 (-) Transcript_4315:974-1231(-)
MQLQLARFGGNNLVDIASIVPSPALFATNPHSHHREQTRSSHTINAEDFTVKGGQDGPHETSSSLSLLVSLRVWYRLRILKTGLH